MLLPRLMYVLEIATDAVFLAHLSQAELDRLDDEENYVLVDPETKQKYVNGSWENIPIGKIQTDGQMVVIPNG